MRTGEHDRIGAHSIIHKAGLNLAADRVLVDGDPAHSVFGEAREPFRATQRDPAVAGKRADELERVVPANGSRGGQHAHALGFRLCAGGLDGRHRSNERDRKACTQHRQRQRRSGVARDNDEGRTQHFDIAAKNGNHAFNERAIIEPPVWKASIVGNEGKLNVPSDAREFLQDGQPAKPGIEYKNRARLAGSGGIMVLR